MHLRLAVHQASSLLHEPGCRAEREAENTSRESGAALPVALVCICVLRYAQRARTCHDSHPAYHAVAVLQLGLWPGLH